MKRQNMWSKPESELVFADILDSERAKGRESGCNWPESLVHVGLRRHAIHFHLRCRTGSRIGKPKVLVKL